MHAYGRSKRNLKVGIEINYQWSEKDTDRQAEREGGGVQREDFKMAVQEA